MPTGTVSKVREIIKAEELIKMLQNNVLDDNAKPLHQSKLHAIKILLAKSIPDLKAIEVTGKEGGAIQQDIQVEFVVAQDTDS